MRLRFSAFNPRALAAAAALSFAACGAPPLSPLSHAAVPWAQFRLNTSNDAVLPGSLRVNWRTQTDGAFSSSPAIVGERLFIGNNAGTLYALDVRDGHVLWKHHVAAPLMSNPLVVDGSIIVGEGNQDFKPSSGPALVIGSGENALVAVDARNGSERWRIPLTGSAMATPAIVNGYLIEHDGANRVIVADPKTGTVLHVNGSASNATMGRILPMGGDRFLTSGQNDNVIQQWSIGRDSPAWSTSIDPIDLGVADCPPAGDGRRVYCDYIGVFYANVPYKRGMPIAQWVYAIDDATGAIVWNREMPEAAPVSKLPSRNKAAIPLLVGDTLFVGHPVAPYVHAIATRDGRLRWSLRVHGSVLGGIAYRDGVLYFGDLEGYLWAVDARTGRPIGVKAMHAPFNVGSPVIAGKTLFIGSKTGAVIAVPLDEIRSARAAAPMPQPMVNGEWTQFRLNPRHDAVLPGTLRVSWRTQTDGGYSSSPAVDGNAVYLGNNAGSLYALDLRTGHVLWRYHVRASLMSNPLLWNGLVIAGEGDQNYRANFWDLRHPMKIGATENALFAVNERTGKLQWRTPISGTGMPTPAIIGGMLIHHNGGGEIVFLDPETGRILRRVDAGGGATMSAILPLSGDRFATIGMFGGGPLIVLTGKFETTVQERSSHDGRLLWSVRMADAASGVGDCPPATDGRFILCNYVAINQRGGIGVGAQAVQHAFALDVRSGALAWDVSLERGSLAAWNRSAIPLVAGNTVYFGSPLGPDVQALATQNGALRWRMQAKGSVKGGIARKDGVLYFGDRAGYLWAVDAATGKTIGVKNVRAPFNVGSPVIVGDTLVAGTNKGVVLAVPLEVIRNSRDR